MISEKVADIKRWRTKRDDFFFKWRTFRDDGHIMTIFSKKWRTFRDGGHNMTADRVPQQKKILKNFLFIFLCKISTPNFDPSQGIMI